MQETASLRFRAFALACTAFTAAAGAGVAVAPDVATGSGQAGAAASSFIGGLHKISTISSAVPTTGTAKGDQNPYGVAVVPNTMGSLVAGDVLVSDFNNKKNQQGTGSTIVQLSPSGQQSVFAVVPKPTSTPAVGLTTALMALKNGFVIVGSLPAPGGSSSKARSGALTVLDSQGKVVTTITSPDINGPWDMTAVDNGTSAVLFVTNVLNGTVSAKGKVVKRGTVVRIQLSVPSGGTPAVVSNQVIATGFPEHTDPSALIVGPTGVGLGPNGTLYVADSADNRIAAIPNAMTRTTVLGRGGMTLTKGRSVNDPLGLMVSPNGDVISANGGNGNLVETSPSGHQVATKTLVRNGGGDLFGLALFPDGHGIYFVDDAGSGGASNSLQSVH
jgi:sugar lactone lactonase YvrE